MAAHLMVFDKTVPAKKNDDLPSFHGPKLAHGRPTRTDVDTVSSNGIGSPCLIMLARWHSMASRACSLDESRSSPYVTQPGKAGTVTVNPPSGSGVRMTVY